MLYRIFKVLFTLTIRAYFRSIYVKGKENIPSNGPVIFASNHNSAFMDPILIGVQVKRILYFLTRGDVFKKGIANRFFRSVNMIPVYLPDLSPGETYKNEDTFRACFEHLEKGKTIIIFPEGTSRTERRLRPIKTGLARIALGAESRNDFSLNIKIIPIGLNYSNPHHFRSDVFVNFGEPVSLSDFKEDYHREEWPTVEKLTERIKTELEKLVVVIEDERLDKLIRQIEILYRSKLREESSLTEKAPQDFYLSKDIVRAVELYARENPDTLHEFERKIDNYLQNLKRLKIRDTQVRASNVSIHFLQNLFYFSLGLPLFLYGLIGNVIPFRVAEFISKKVTVRYDFIGSLKIAAGMFIFLFLYIIEAFIVGSFAGFYWSLAFLFSLYPSGLFTISYLKRYYLVRGTMMYMRLFMKKSDLIARLKLDRKELVDILEEGKARYLKREDR